MAETVVLQIPEALVTTTRVQIGATMIPLQAIGSVTTYSHSAKRGGLIATAMFAGIGAWVSRVTGAEGVMSLMILCVILCIGVAAARRTTYSVNITTMGGPQQVMVTRDMSLATKVSGAITVAIANR